MRIGAIILAGGMGRRMGGADKALIPFGDRPLIAHVLARIAPQVGAVAISANGDPARFAAFDLPVLADAQSRGPLSGILSGLRHARDLGLEAMVSVPCDTPFLPDDLVSRLVGAGGAGPTHAVAGGRDHNATALWPVALEGALAAFLASGEKPRIAGFAAAQGGRGVAFPDPAAFDNLNTPQELAAAAARAGVSP